jgi:hypothetical protein
VEAQHADPRGPVVAEEVTPSFAIRKATNPFHGTVESILSQEAVSVEVNSVSLNHYPMHHFTMPFPSI